MHNGSEENIDRYAVLGHPISHSLSPYIHHWFARQNRQHILYEKIDCPAHKLAITLDEFFRAGGCGVNLTLPLKSLVLDLLSDLSPTAVRAGAVNTIVRMPSKKLHLHGDNTDGLGLVSDLRYNLGFELAGKNLLIIGAGGAARGILGALADTQPDSIMLANRSPAKAQQLASEYRDADVRITAVRTFAELASGRFDGVINATAASLTSEMLNLPPLSVSTWGYDLAYMPKPTVFMQWLMHHNPHLLVSDGLGMLVEQAAQAYYLWRNILPKTAALIRKLRLGVKILPSG